MHQLQCSDEHSLVSNYIIIILTLVIRLNLHDDTKFNEFVQVRIIFNNNAHKFLLITTVLKLSYGFSLPACIKSVDCLRSAIISFG